VNDLLYTKSSSSSNVSTETLYQPAVTEYMIDVIKQIST